MVKNFKKVKICIVGPMSAGKSSLALRFVEDEFHKDGPTTIGAAFMRTVLHLTDFDLECNIWDTSGQEQFFSLAPSYYRGAVAAILVYDVTEITALKDIQIWISELKRHGAPHMTLAIAANKCDLKENRKIGTNEGELFAKSLDALYYETSAKTGDNVKKMFYELARNIPTKYMLDESHESRAFALGENPPKSSRSCCS